MSFLLFFLGVLVVILPFLPSVWEAVRKTDTHPLRISRQILKDPRTNPEYIFLHFAHSVGFDDMDLFKEKLSVSEPQYFNSTFLAIPGGKIKEAFPKTVARVISANSLELPAKTAYAAKILSMNSIVADEKSLFNEVHAKENLQVGPGCKLVWWASANQMKLGKGVSLPGKIQAKTEILFEDDATFHFLAAPSIRTQNWSLPNTFLPVVETTAQEKPRHIIFKDHEIKANEVYQGNIIAKNLLVIGANAKVHGSVKCYGKLVVEKGAQIFGNVIGLRDVEFKGENWVNGSVLVNDRVTLGNRCLVGNATHQVTCSAKEVRVLGSIQVHGVLRAWKSGSISSSISGQNSLIN